MCTMIAQQVAMKAAAKGRPAGSTCGRPTSRMITHLTVPLEHALNIDFVNEALGPGARVAVELSASRRGRW